MKRLIGALLTVLILTPAALAEDLSLAARVEQAMFGDHRSERNVARNRYRHPVGTLTFFGIEDGMTVMEIWPGGGWYTEVLAPAIRDHGTFIVAAYDVSVPDQPDYRYRQQKTLEQKFADRPDLYDQVQIQPFSPPQSGSLGDKSSVDLIVTFRHAHGWVGSGIADEMFAEFARVLKPGGRVGIVQHRADAGTDPAVTSELGYLSEEAVIEIAEGAGLQLKARSEVNANPKDTKDHPEGVWTLPPSLDLGETDQDKYLAIGESDRMTLVFVKPIK